MSEISMSEASEQSTVAGFDPVSASPAAALNEQVYDRVPPGHLDYWRFMAAPRFRMDTILSILDQLSPRTVVDLGCGTGLLLARLADHLPSAGRVGIDIASRQIEIAHRSDPTADWHVLDLDKAVPEIPAAIEGGCDAIVAAELVEHLDHPQRLLCSARRLASPGARLILSTQSGPVRETERRVGHRRHFSIEDMNQLLESSGWTPLQVWNAGWPFHDLSKWWANRNPENSMQRFGEQAYGWSERAVCWTLRQLFRLNSSSRGAQLFALAEPGPAPVDE